MATDALKLKPKLSALEPHEHAAMTMEMLVNLFESAFQASDDFVGEQREWHLPRLQKAARLAMKLYGVAAFTAMERAKTPYGPSLLEKGVSLDE
jgi:hypothetical protein